MKAIDAIATTSDATVDLVTSVHEGVLGGLRTITSAFDTDAVPAVTDWVPAAGPEGARELVEATYSLGSRLIEANRAFAVGLLDVVRLPSST